MNKINSDDGGWNYYNYINTVPVYCARASWVKQSLKKKKINISKPVVSVPETYETYKNMPSISTTISVLRRVVCRPPRGAGSFLFAWDSVVVIVGGPDLNSPENRRKMLRKKIPKRTEKIHLFTAKMPLKNYPKNFFTVYFITKKTEIYKFRLDSITVAWWLKHRPFGLYYSF